VCLSVLPACHGQARPYIRLGFQKSPREKKKGLVSIRSLVFVNPVYFLHENDVPFSFLVPILQILFS